ncbi:MAG: AsmA family protein [Desulfovibrio sp.]|uniref:AsmA family protein n=1 Tax=Desulfovibrio sp. 7SRBS1 TaxID=3378064 RepID=UPI003B3F84ED
MKKRYAFPLISVLGGLLLATVLVVFGPALVNTSLLKNALSQYIYNVSGRTAVFDGDVRLSLVPTFGFECNDATLSGLEGENPHVLGSGVGPAPLLSVGRARVEVRLFPLFSHRVEFKAIELDDVKVNLRREAQGAPDPDELPEAGAAGAGNASVGDWTFSFTPSGVRADNLGVHYSDAVRGWFVDISNATLAVTEREGGDIFSLHGGYLVSLGENAPLRSVRGWMSLDGRGKCDRLLRDFRIDDMQVHSTGMLDTASGESVDSEFSAAGAWDSQSGNLVLREAKVESEGLHVGLNGAGRLALGDLTGNNGNSSLPLVPEVDGEFQLKAEKPARLLRRLGMRPPRALDKEVELLGRFSLNGTELAVSKATGTVAGSDFSASLFTQWVADPWTALDLHLDSLDLNKWSAPDAMGAQSPRNPLYGKERGRPLRDVLRRLNLDLLCNVDDIRAGKVQASNATLDVSAHGGLFQVRRLAANFAKGRLMSSLRMQVFEDDLSVQGQLRILGTSLNSSGTTRQGDAAIFTTSLNVNGRVDSYRGTCDIPRFNPSDLIATFGLDIPKLPDGKTWRPVSALFDFEGTDDSFKTRSARLGVNGDVLQLDLDVQSFSHPEVTFFAKTRRVDLDKLSVFLGALGAERPSRACPADTVGAVSLQPSGNDSRFKGRVQLDELRVGGQNVRNLDLAVDTGTEAGAELRFNAQVHGGTVSLSAVRKEQGNVLNLHLLASDWDTRSMPWLAQLVGKKQASRIPAGRVRAEVSASGKGATLGQWLSGSSGQAKLRFVPVSDGSRAKALGKKDAKSGAELFPLRKTTAVLGFSGRKESDWNRPVFDLSLRGGTAVDMGDDRRGSLKLEADAIAWLKPSHCGASSLEKGRLQLEYLPEGAVAINGAAGKNGASGTKDVLGKKNVSAAPDSSPTGVFSQHAQLNGTFSLDGERRILTVDRAVAMALGLHLDASGSLQFGEKPLRASGHFALNDFNPRELIKTLGGGTFKLKDDTALRNMALASDFDWQAGDGKKAPQTRLEEMRFVLDQTVLEGTVDVSGFEWPQVKTKLSGNEFNYNRYLPAPTGMLEPVVYPVDMIRKLDFMGEVQIDKLTIYSMTYTNCQSRVSVKDGLLAVTDTTAFFKGGRVKGTLYFKALGDELQFSTQAEVRGFEMGGMLEEMAGKDYIRGKADFSLNLNGHGPTNLDLLQSLAGWGALKMGNGAYNFGSDRSTPRQPELSVENFLDQGNLGPKDRKDPWTHFSKASISLKVLDGVATSDDLVINQPVIFSASGKGFCDLYLEFLDYTLTMQYLNTATIPVRMVGPWDDVKVGVSAMGAIQATGVSIFKDILNLPVNIIRTFLP